MSKKKIEVSKRQLMFAENVRRIVADILIKDIFLERMGVKQATITKAAAGADLKIVKLNVALFGDEASRTKAMLELQKNKRKIKALLAPHLAVRFIPDLQFVIDDNSEEEDSTFDESAAAPLTDDML